MLQLSPGFVYAIKSYAGRLVWACKRSGTHVDFDDLFQVAMIECWRASAHHDPRRSRLETFLYKRALGAMIDYLRSTGWGKRRPKGGDHPPAPLSLEAFSEAAFGREDEDSGFEPADERAEAAFEGAEDHVDLVAAFGTLSDRERYVLAQYYFADRPLTAIGDELGVSESRISQIKTRAERRLRTQLAS
ncbi:MAG: sigma-70 family RNA polymerase sigma factor [Actinomycetota bacterium]